MDGGLAQQLGEPERDEKGCATTSFRDSAL